LKRGEFLETDVHLALDGPQRMMGWDGGVEVQDGEEVGLSLGFTPHAIETSPMLWCLNFLARLFQLPANRLL
jgi:hypothetical protein